MTDHLTFTEVYQEYAKKLALFVPVVEKVHGGHHPEFHEVRVQYQKLVALAETAPLHPEEMQNVFSTLRETTRDYAVPTDVCESYQAVYHMLEELERAYRYDNPSLDTDK